GGGEVVLGGPERRGDGRGAAGLDLDEDDPVGVRAAAEDVGLAHGDADVGGEEAVPVSAEVGAGGAFAGAAEAQAVGEGAEAVEDRLGEIGRSPGHGVRSEEHTSELQSRENLVCRLLLEKKK